MNKNELIKKQICSFLDRAKPETRFIYIQTINENGHIIDRLKTGYITEPEYIHFTGKDNLLGMKVRLKESGCNVMGIITYQSNAAVVIVDNTYTYDELHENFTNIDGSPLGILKNK